MAVPMVDARRSCALFAGVVQIPGVTHVIENFLDPTFADSRFARSRSPTAIEALALVVGGDALARSASASPT